MQRVEDQDEAFSHAMGGGRVQFHVAFYMLSTLGGAVDQSAAAGKGWK